MSDVKARHANALLYPVIPEERSLSILFTELGRLSDRHKNDSVMVPAIESLGSAIITLLNGEVGRIDQGSLDKQVRDTVVRAGGRGDAL